MDATEHATRCIGRHALNDQADDGTWSTTCVRCGWKVEGYETRAAADAALLGEESGEP